MAEKKQTWQIIALAVLLGVAAVVWYTQYFRKPPADSSLSLSSNYVPINADDISIIFDPLQRSQATEYKSTGHNIFIAGAIPPPVDPALNVPKKPVKPSWVNKGPIPPAPLPPPPPPVLAMRFFGYGTIPVGGSRRAFLLDGDEVRIVSEGDVVLNHIRITHIGNEKLEYEDTNTHLRGSNNLEAGATPPA